MSTMDRADDFAFYVNVQLGVQDVVHRIPIPRNCRLTRSIWTQMDPWDGNVVVKMTSSYGDLSDTLSVTVAGSEGSVHIVDHRIERNNTFIAGTSMAIEVTNLSAGDEAEVVFVMRVL